MKIKPNPSRRPRAPKARPAFRETVAQPATSPATSARLLPWAIVLLVILLAAVVRIRLLEIPLERDEGEYAYAGQLLLQGIPPYQAAFNMKFPGVYGAYAVIMAAFGQTIAGIHLGLLLLNAGAIVLVFLFGRRLFTTASGVAAAAAYALLSAGAGVYGTEAHATHFVIAAALGATLLLLRGLAGGKPAALFFSGLLYGVAVLMKQHGALFAIFGGLYLLWDHWSEHRGSWPAILRKLAIFILGAAVPLALTAFALWRARVFDQFWFWTVTYAREYALEVSLDEGIKAFTLILPQVVGPNLLLWLFAAAGLGIVWWRKAAWQKPHLRSPAFFATAFLVFSFLAVCPGFYFRGHYFILLLPAIALLAGVAADSLRSIGWCSFAAVLAISLAWQGDFLFHDTPLEACRRMYHNSPFPEAIEVAAYLRAHTAKEARIAVLGSEPEIYFYSGRRSATGYIYTYGMMEHQPFALTMQNQMIHDVESVRPEYIVFVNDAASWVRQRDSQAKILTWWNAYAAQNYTVAAAADIFADKTVYQWDHLETYRPSSQLYIVICKRNPA